MSARKLAVFTGASTGIGLELARCAAKDGCDLILCAGHDAMMRGKRGVVPGFASTLLAMLSGSFPRASSRRSIGAGLSPRAGNSAVAARPARNCTDAPRIGTRMARRSWWCEGRNPRPKSKEAERWHCFQKTSRR